MTNVYEALIAEITATGDRVERVIMGRDDSEVRVIYLDRANEVYRCRALVEGSENNRKFYDIAYVNASLTVMVVMIEEDIAECYV